MLPDLFLERMKTMLGQEFEAFLDSYDLEKFQALRVNRLKRNAEGATVLETVQGLFHLSPVPWADMGYYYEKEDAPGKHPLHEAGAYYIQEPSAMAPVGFLGVQPGDHVLDLCAAPGGKSTQIAAYLEGKGILVANEIHPARAKILSENMERLGVVNACVTNETPARLAQVFPEYFDRILVDAPCSGEGMFRKNEDACEEWSPENVALCAQRQEEILDCAATMLRAGGRIVYSTCTFAPAENEESIQKFLERHQDFKLLPIDKKLFYPKEEKPMESLAGTLRLYPHKLKGEGHFAAVLEKEGQLDVSYHPASATGTNKAVKEKEMGDYTEFFSQNISEQQHILEDKLGDYIKFGDHIFFVPKEMPGITGLKVLRPGLHVGTMKKNRFEPSHALALAMNPSEAVHVYELADENQIKAYLNGQTFPVEGEKGWYVICAYGFSIGWGKLAGGIMKNHYPKGLRKP